MDQSIWRNNQISLKKNFAKKLERENTDIYMLLKVAWNFYKENTKFLPSTLQGHKSHKINTQYVFFEKYIQFYIFLAGDLWEGRGGEKC